MKRILCLILVAAMSVAIVSCGQKEPQLPKIVKIGRTDCLSCKDLSKILDGLKPKIEGKAAIEVINLEDDPGAMEEYEIKGIPTLLAYDTTGNEISRSIGVKTEQEILEMLVKAGMK